MADAMDVQRGIEESIKQLEDYRRKLPKYAEDRAKSIAEYDKALAVTMLKMKNGQIMELDGQKIDSPATTVTEKLAKGMVWRERLEMEKAEGMHSALITNIKCIQAELLGKQSILKISSMFVN